MTTQADGEDIFHLLVLTPLLCGVMMSAARCQQQHPSVCMYAHAFSLMTYFMAH